MGERKAFSRGEGESRPAVGSTAPPDTPPPFLHTCNGQWSRDFSLQVRGRFSLKLNRRWDFVPGAPSSGHTATVRQ